MLNDSPEYTDVFVEWGNRVHEDAIAVEALVRDLQESLGDIEERLRVEAKRLAELHEEKKYVAEAALKHKERMESNGRRAPLAGKTLWETLIIHFASAEGVIVGREAVDTLLRLKYFPDRNSANGAVYTNLAKSIFKKVRPGTYQISTDSPDWIRLRGSNGHRSPRQLPSSSQAEVDVVAALARQQGGQIRNKQVRETLAMFLEQPLDSGPVGFATTRVLSRSKCFEKVSRGLYRLVDFNAGDTILSQPAGDTALQRQD